MNSSAAASRLLRPRGHQPQHLELARAQRRLGLGRADAAEQRRRHGGGEDGVAVGSGADAAQQLLARRVLEQVAGGAGVDRGQHVGVVAVGGEDEHADLREPVAQLADRGDAVAAGHPQVHQHHLRPAGDGERDRLDAGGRLAQHLELGVAGEDPAQPVAHDRVVVGDQQRDHAGTAGTLAEIAVPSPGVDSTASAPPTPCTRWRMPVSPKPPRVGSKPTPSSRTSSVTRSSM